MLDEKKVNREGILNMTAHFLGFENMEELAKALDYESAQEMAEAYGFPNIIDFLTSENGMDSAATKRYLELETRLINNNKTSGYGLYPTVNFKTDFFQSDVVVEELVLNNDRAKAIFTCLVGDRSVKEILSSAIEILQAFMLIKGEFIINNVWYKFPKMGSYERKLHDNLPVKFERAKLTAYINQLGPGPINCSKVSVWVDDNPEPIAQDVKITFHLIQVSKEQYVEFLQKEPK